MREVKEGDYFLLPFAGTRRDRLIRAVRPLRPGIGDFQWHVINADGKDAGIVLLSSCTRCGPKTAAAILKEPRQ